MQARCKIEIFSSKIIQIQVLVLLNMYNEEMFFIEILKFVFICSKWPFYTHNLETFIFWKLKKKFKREFHP